MVDWLQVGQTSGSGDTQILVRATPNEGAARYTTLLLSGITKHIDINIEQEKYSAYDRYDYLTFNIVSGTGGIYFYTSSILSSRGLVTNVYYSLNDGEWVSIPINGSYTYISGLTVGDIVKFKGTAMAYYVVYDSNERYCHFGDTSSDSDDFRYTVGGNIMSLLTPEPDDFANMYTLSNDDVFHNLFKDSEGLLEASDIIMPATALTTGCYQDMFDGCTSLTTAPELPATTLVELCYSGMFYGCSSLTTAPILPATTLADSCYYGMFQDCTSLTTASQLPATTLTDNCYDGMFDGCTLLTIAPELPATTLAESCYVFMFRGCTSLTTAPELPATTLADWCYYGMFNGCTSLTTAPQLPSTEPKYHSYDSMFANCTSLERAPDLPATTTVSRQCYEHMFSGCESLNYVKCLLDVPLSEQGQPLYTYQWMSGVGNRGTFVRGGLYNRWISGDSSYVPLGWTITTE